MYNLKSTLKIEGNEILIFKPDVCPFCKKGIDPIIISRFIIENSFGCVLYVAMQCPVCGQVFFCKYLLGLSIYDVSLSGMAIPYNGIIGGEAIRVEFSDEINKVSPKFVKIYNQAFEAEQRDLDEIDGMGYRKAFEFLVKDYAVFVKPEDKEAISKQTISQCISFIFNKEDKEIFEKTGWIGNDQTHYEKKHGECDVSDLKKMIMICVSKIETRIRKKQYLESIHK